MDGDKNIIVVDLDRAGECLAKEFQQSVKANANSKKTSQAIINSSWMFTTAAASGSERLCATSHTMSRVFGVGALCGSPCFW